MVLEAAGPAAGRLSNDDLAPTTAAQATWRTWDIFCLWMTSAHSLGSYGFAVGMLALGLTGWQTMLALFTGVLVLWMGSNLIGIAGQRLGVPFPVFARATFGVFGANIPALLRGLVAIFFLVRHPDLPGIHGGYRAAATAGPGTAGLDGTDIPGPTCLGVGRIPFPVDCAAADPELRHGSGAQGIGCGRPGGLDRDARPGRMDVGQCGLEHRLRRSYRRTAVGCGHGIGVRRGGFPDGRFHGGSAGQLCRLRAFRAE